MEIEHTFYINDWGHWSATISSGSSNTHELISLKLIAKAAKIPLAINPKIGTIKWIDELESQITKYTQGQIPDFSSIPVKLPGNTNFTKKIYEELRKVTFGKTCTYGDLALKVGAPKAARAVGAAMAKNPLILIYPCHRIIGRSGKLTGFSAEGGVVTKGRMLKLEKINVN